MILYIDEILTNELLIKLFNQVICVLISVNKNMDHIFDQLVKVSDILV